MDSHSSDLSAIIGNMFEAPIWTSPKVSLSYTPPGPSKPDDALSLALQATASPLGHPSPKDRFTDFFSSQKSNIGSSFKEIFGKFSSKIREGGTAMLPKPGLRDIITNFGSAVSSKTKISIEQARDSGKSILPDEKMEKEWINRSIRSGLDAVDQLRQSGPNSLNSYIIILRENDEPSLRNAATGNGSFRRFATAPRACSINLSQWQKGVKTLPKTAQEAVHDLQKFYENNKDLIALGDAARFNNFKPTADDVNKIKKQIREGVSLMLNLKMAMKPEQLPMEREAE
ncbi:MAG TPA: hypothetical protein VL598_13720 [Trinickia sp.]|uniref:hypothetical protein n=1 Tax=Trinickia sp. TaxID=2571163 RepID=UPI002C2DBEFC|nr:hypothetical protein [Trinickia sp.]HTI18716.1 hypothetical protein [Trinickia sp.]